MRRKPRQPTDEQPGEHSLKEASNLFAHHASERAGCLPLLP
jgi:hypothetical protein